MAGIDYQQLCRDTQHVPLVQAAIDPSYINVWSEQESKRAGRFEQYSFKTQRIDVRTEHDISLYHGLIHRTLDLIGESDWKHRDYGPHEDREHWLIYHTLETHWPGVQWRQGREPSSATLLHAGEYWRQQASRYTEIIAKASALAEESWCAINAPTMEVRSIRPTNPPPEKPQRVSMTVALSVAVAPANNAKPAEAALPIQAAAPLPEPAPAARATVAPPSASLDVEPIWVMSEFLSAPSQPLPRISASPRETLWAGSPDQPVPQPIADVAPKRSPDPFAGVF